MAIFIYKARDPQGTLIYGELDVADEKELTQIFNDKGLIPVSIKKGGGLSLKSVENLFQTPVHLTEILVFTRQFYTLFKAGMSMESVLGTLIRQTTNKKLKDALQDIRNRISSGSSLSKAFEAHEAIFGELYTSMLAAGEEAGILEEVLKNLSELIEKEMQIKTSIKSATMYPKIVIFVLFMASLVIMNFVMPKFASFFAHYKAELPLPTKILIFSSNVFQNYWYIAIITFFAIGWIYNRYSKTARGKLRVGALRFKVPVFGVLNIKIANSRFCHILGALYRSGLPITRSLEITGHTIENGAFMRDVEMLKDDVTRGKTLSEGMADCQYFTPIIIDATAVGEKTGSLDEMLESIGQHYDLEVQHMIKNLTTLLEPILLFFIFGMVTVFTLAIFLPIWNISKVVTKH